ncbi:uncharacterized protein B0I36DRAFT_366964 [Microdochium trichocladiopsis]|uniref:Glycoside hydrolase family 5 C-terminal domain-containing protein n=1 Tax=Microdochium trichocladiopsis TaxID=1682393 RepID=A0A9P8XYD0_9PEZI|nr:uncharacterized protein B0I36DRAFT_366964 [Microdochium trichocladiopsis]KAH7025068.1 hypothetical protein B0I36DRAFT_366964 [Microdochium trichocladiopsis]
MALPHSTSTLLPPGTVHLVLVERDDEIVLVPKPSSHPDDPLNWSKYRKLLHIICVYMYTFTTGVAATATYSCLVDISRETGITLTELNLGTGFIFLLAGWGNLIWQPLALSIGRRPVFLLSLVGCFAITEWTAHISSFPQWAAARILYGFMVAPVEVLPEISIPDTYFAHERGAYVGYYSLILNGSNFIAPLCAGFMNDAIGWRWVQHWGAILLAFNFVFSFFLQEESMYFRSTVEADTQESDSAVEIGQIARVASAGTANDNDNDHDNDNEKQKTTSTGSPDRSPSPTATTTVTATAATSGTAIPQHPKPMWKRITFYTPSELSVSQALTISWRPIVMLYHFPNILWAGFQYGFTNSWYSVYNATASLILTSAPFNFTSSMVGVTYLAPLFGAVIGGFVAGPVSDKLALRLAHRNQGLREPEHRLWGLVSYGVILPLGLLMWGVGAAHGAPLGVILVGSVFCGFGIVSGGSFAIAYDVDCFKEIAGESMVSLILVRNTMTFAFSYAITPWIEASGLQNTFIAVGVIALVTGFSFLLMIWKGKSFREKGAESPQSRTMLESHAAPDLSDAALGGVPMRIRGHRFVDGYNRVVIPRGLNVSGCSKLPTTPDGRSHLTEGFYDLHRTVSFVGRPFPLEDAPFHLGRLRTYGLTFIRLLVTWESLGHAGPNPATDLDVEYIDYLRRLVAMMPQYGLKCFICAHQDVWSRFSGGSGAPAWTFEAAGFDIEAFTDTGAAYIHGQDEARRAGGLAKDNEPSGPFVWPSGYQKLAASTMATLFWAGDALAPKLRCMRTVPSPSGKGEAEVSVQTFLQDALIEAFGRLADAVSPLEACIGFEAMNEPHRGLVNLHHVHNWNYDTDLHIGHYPSFLQALALGSGYPQEVPFYVKTWPYPTRVSHYSRIDPKGRPAWLTGDLAVSSSAPDRPKGLGGCVWQAHGVWEWNSKTQSPIVLEDKYFEYDHRPGREGRPLEWYRDCYAPFVRRFNERMRRARSTAAATGKKQGAEGVTDMMAFVAPIPNEFMPPWQPVKHETAARRQTYATKTIIDTPRPENMVYAPHFYDLNVLFNKEYSGVMSVDVQGLSRGVFPLKALHFLSAGLRRNYSRQIGNIVKHGPLSLGGNVPTIIGEIGIPFDINGKVAYRTGNFDIHRDLYNALIAGMEDSLVGFTLWNYNPGNTVEFGDGWNKEDFSMFTSDAAPEHVPDYRNAEHEADEVYKGGRAIDVLIRPYAAKIAGEPTRTSWDPRTLRFELDWTVGGKDVSAGHKDKKKALLDELEDKAHQTEIFLPAYHYAGKKLVVRVNDADWSYNAVQQTLYVRSRLGAGLDGGRAGKRLAAKTHRVVVEIEGLQEHLLKRVLQRRQALGKVGQLGILGTTLATMPPAVEVWVEDVLAGRDETLLGVLAAVLIMLLAIILAKVV